MYKQQLFINQKKFLVVSMDSSDEREISERENNG